MTISARCFLATAGALLLGCGTSPSGSTPAAATVSAGPSATESAPAATTAPVAAKEEPSAAPAASSGPATPTGTPGSCDGAVISTWPSCVGTQVTVKGRDPGPNVHQHPMLVGPPGAGSPTQQYMDVPGGGQIILLLKQPVTCRDAMQVTGTLRAIRLGGAPGTKESYSGYSIDGATVKCL